MLPPIRCFTCNFLFTEAVTPHHPHSRISNRYCCERMRLGFEQDTTDTLMRTESMGFKTDVSQLRIGVLRNEADADDKPVRRIFL